MRKVVKLLVVLMMIFVAPPAFAVGPTINNLDIIDENILDIGCIDCGKLDITSVCLNDAVYNSTAKWICSGCGFSNIFYLSLSGAYSSPAYEVSSVSSQIGGKCEKCEEEIDRYRLALEVLEKNYSKPDNLEFAIHNEVKTLLVGDNIRYLYSVSGDNLNLVSLNIEEVDLYNIANEAIVTVFFTVVDEYDIEPLEFNFGRYISNNGDDKFYLVCKEDAECKECKKYVASNGEDVISDYCSNHACEFIWSTKVGENYYEGLNCKDRKVEGSSFCYMHKCKSCNSPVIGVNTKSIVIASMEYINDFMFNSGSSNVTTNYSGNNAYGYSNYCEEHFCIMQGCRGLRVSSAGGYAFCSTHAEMCVYPGCTSLKSNRSSVYLCEYHRNMDDFEVCQCELCGEMVFGAECVGCKLDGSEKDVLVELNGTAMCNHEFGSGKGAVSETSHIFIDECVKCNYRVERGWEPHEFDQNGKCSICLYVSCEHEWHNGYTYISEIEHDIEKTCIYCGKEERIYGEHTFDEIGKCECGYTESFCIHRFQDDRYECNNEYIHNRLLKCSLCGMENAIQKEHEYSNGKCTKCGYTKECIDKDGHEWKNRLHYSIANHKVEVYCGKCDTTLYIIYVEHELNEDGKCECGYEEESGQAANCTHYWEIYGWQRAAADKNNHTTVYMCVNCLIANRVSEGHKFTSYVYKNSGTAHYKYEVCVECGNSRYFGTEVHNYKDCKECENNPYKNGADGFVYGDYSWNI